MEFTATQRLDSNQCWDFQLPDSHPIGVEDSVLILKECENSHTLTTTNPGPETSLKEANNQTDNQNQCTVPPKVLHYQLLVLVEVKCKTCTQQQTQLMKLAIYLTGTTYSVLFKLLAVALRVGLQKTYCFL